MADLSGGFWALVVGACVAVACNTAPEQAISKRTEALTPGPTFTLQLPPQLTSGGAGLSATTAITLGDRAKVKQATGSAFAGVVNLGTGLTLIGQDSVTGDVWSVGSVQLQDRATVSGFLKTAGTLSPGANTTITGTIQQSQPLPAPTLSTVTVQFQNGASAVTVGNDATRTLSPGDYAAVSLGARAVLALSTGDYRFDSLATQLPSTLRLTTTAGPVRIFVRNTFSWNSTVTAAAGDPTKLLLGYVGSAAITVNTPFTGTLLSPNAAVTLPTGSSPHSGAFFAKTLSTQPDVVVTTRPFQQPCQGVVIDDGNACTTDACDPNTGVVTHLPVVNGTACSDGNACTQSDSCQAGVCVGANPVVCTAQDQCHSVGVCAPATGLCSNPNKVDGSSCSDNNACTQSDTCQAGACVGAAPITCSALDQCHSAGTCNAATGVCSNPPKADGTSCTDGNGCTQSDTCQAGACVGSNPVLCVALDQCHAAGSCDSATGTCSNPLLPNGSACSDGDSCTQSDSCQAGVCTGSSPVVCSALDQCHSAGSCNPASGVCTNPIKADGSACSDGNACTQADTCQSGSCIGGSPVVCAALDQCHLAGTCNAATGACSNPVKANGASCSDGDSCTQNDTCQAGGCVSGSPVVCVALDQCHVAGSCDASSGTCSNPVKADGAACNDASACTTGETCAAGVCQPGTPVATDDGNPCTADACDPLVGVSHTPVSAGTACDDSDLCNGHEACNAIGFCSAGTPVVVDDGNPCTADSCDATGGVAHTPVAAGTSCSDGNACNGVEACTSSGQCLASALPAIDDGNACTEDACDPAQGITHVPVAAGLSCADSTVCNGDERCDALGTCNSGSPPVVDDGDACTTDSCDPVTGVLHVPVPNCGGAPEEQFETRASIMGRVIHADGSPAAGFTVRVFNDTLDSAPRGDAATTIDPDGSFRVRLLDFPQSVAARTPPQAILIRIESEEFPSLQRSAYLRPGDVAALGTLTVLQRDPKVTVIGPEGGTAQDSQGTLELQIPAGALSEPTPVRLTPIPTRAQFPTPLPSNTVSMYGMEIEPSGTVLGQPATLRVKNTLNLPTTMKIPVGTIDPRYGDWAHEGFAVWDGSRFSTKVSHFSPHDVNGPRLGELLQIVSEGADRNKTKSSKCAASSINDANGALQQSFEVPLHSASGRDYSLTLNYTTELSGSVAVGKGPAAPFPAQSLVRSFATQSIRLLCVPPGSGSGCPTAAGGGGGGGPPCRPGSGGSVVLPAYTFDQHVKLFDFDVDESSTMAPNAQNAEPTFYVPLPTGDDGSVIRSGFIPLQITSSISVPGSSACVGGLGGFGVAGGAFSGLQRLPVVTGNLSDFPTYQFVVHRRGSPLGSGWAFNETSTLYRPPDGLTAEVVHGNGQAESFRPYPVLKKIAQFENNVSPAALAFDPQTAELFAARSNFGVGRVDAQSGTITVVAGGVFGDAQAVDLKVTYADGVRRFLVTTVNGLYEALGDGTSRQLVTFPAGPFDRVPSVAGVGKYAYYAIGQKNGGPTGSLDATTVSRIDLTDPLRATTDISPTSGGELRFDPHGEVQAQNFQFLRPSGLAAAFDGGLYVADERRHAVYHLAPNEAGEVGPNSLVTRILGSGVDTMTAGPGRKMNALQVAIRGPGLLATAPGGALFVKGAPEIGGLLALDTIEKTARWVAFDSAAKSGPNDPISVLPNLSFQSGSVAPLNADDVMLAQSGIIVRLSTPLSSQYEPLRTLT
ncbi:MAG TPA: hypothetical protein VFK05_23095, partial [Polyangiaceae bacterium]|nr:hypothetical protein [Polyangiaceae bacterium]